MYTSQKLFPIDIYYGVKICLVICMVYGVLIKKALKMAIRSVATGSELPR